MDTIWKFLGILLVSVLTYLSYGHIAYENLLKAPILLLNQTSGVANKGLPKGLKISGLSMDVADIVGRIQQELQYSSKTITKLEQELQDIKKNYTNENKLTIIDSRSINYFDQIKQLDNCKTVFFHISQTMFLNVLGPNIYTVHSNNCTLFTTRAIRSEDFIGLKCQEGLLYPYIGVQHNNISGPKSVYHLQTGYLDLNESASNRFENQSNMVNVGFMHVVKNAKLTAPGDFITGNYYISITRCWKAYRPSFKATSKTYDKVFSISQYWGGGYYHFTNEDLPRIVFAIPFLLENQDIKVHVSSPNGFVRAFLTELGIDKTRLVSGHIHARVAYIPGGSSCGMAPVIPVNILSMFLRATLKYEQKRDTIVLIKRSAKRWFNNHNSILKMLKSIAEKSHLSVKVFGDRPPPTIPESRKLFNRAIMVVAPHGAGLSNIIFSQPGTCVVEGLCYEANKVNHCYKHLAQVLGHIYHGVVPKTQCMQMEPKDLAPSVDQCLKKIRETDEKGKKETIHI